MNVKNAGSYFNKLYLTSYLLFPQRLFNVSVFMYFVNICGFLCFILFYLCVSVPMCVCVCVL
jgi:hypothetical protein